MKRTYLAFKELKEKKGKFYSPDEPSTWKFISIYKGLYLVSQYIPGIYATSWNKIKANNIFLVAPAPELAEKSERFISLEIDSWKATNVIVIGKFDKFEAASLILESYHAKYTQLPGMVVWAAIILHNYDVLKNFLDYFDKGDDETYKVGLRLSDLGVDYLSMNDKDFIFRLLISTNELLQKMAIKFLQKGG